MIVLYGSDGEDRIVGNGGNDILDGLGNDLLYGGSGNDTYVFQIGYGTDTIIDNEGQYNSDLRTFLKSD